MGRRKLVSFYYDAFILGNVFLQLDRYFGTKKLQEAAESLIFEKTDGWSDLAKEYRKELKERF